MKKRIFIMLGSIIVACLVSCQKQNGSVAPKTENELVPLEIRAFESPTKSEIYGSEEIIGAEEYCGEITLWAFSNEETPADECITFRMEAAPKLWLRKGASYCIVAVCNVDLKTGGDITAMNRDEVIRWYDSAMLSPCGNLPLMAINYAAAYQGTIIDLALCHSWAKVNFRIDDVGLNNAYRVQSAKMYACIDGKYSECDHTGLFEHFSNKFAFTLYFPANASSDRLPYVEVNGQLSTSFKGSITYRVPVGCYGESAAKEYSYTLKPTLEHLIHKTGYEWEVEEDIWIDNWSKFHVEADLDHSNYQSRYEAYYPEAWQDLSSSSGSSFSLALVETVQNLIIPKRWYYLNQQSGERLSQLREDEYSTYFLTKHLGTNTFKFTSEESSGALEYSVSTIWQPKILSSKALPACPDTDISSLKFGTELTSMTYSGLIKSPGGSSLIAHAFTTNVSKYYNADSLLDECKAPSLITVTGRSENPLIPVTQNDLIIISSIENQTQNAAWGSAYNISIKNKTIKYTFPSNVETYQKYIYPNIIMSGHMNNTIYINGRKI